MRPRSATRTTSKPVLRSMTSLVAIHLAAQHLISGECDMALAGGVTIEVPHEVGYRYEEGEILSPDGHCRAFDAASKGTVFGSGVGVVVLRRLQDALDAGDTIHAIVKGSAVNNDGGSKVGYLAPSVDGQAASVLEALTVSGVRADQISYVEAHGTGTPIGDPIEVAALTQAFRQHTSKSGFCGLGSLKSNIGHLDTAAGVASFIKVVEALKHHELPPSLHFERPNPAIDFGATPILRQHPAAAVVDQRRPADGRCECPRCRRHQRSRHRAGSAACPRARSGAITQSAADLCQDRHGTRCLDRPVCATFRGHGRSRARRRRVHDCARPSRIRSSTNRRRPDDRRGRHGARSSLQTPHHRRSPEAGALRWSCSFPAAGRSIPRWALICIAKSLASVNRSTVASRSRHDWGITTLRSLMFPQPDQASAAARHLERPCNSILSVFIIEYALAQLWMTWGVKPAACCGHSLGEYTAACLAGVMSLESALALVSKRGELFERLPKGRCSACRCPKQRFERYQSSDRWRLPR